MTPRLSVLLIIPAIGFVGCAANVDDGSTARLLRAQSPEDLEDCEDPQQVCTASYPSTCYWVCADDDGGDGECETESICQLSYPPVCRDVCVDGGGGVDPGECGGIVSASSEEGTETFVCTDPGEGTCSSDDPSCEPGGSDSSPPGSGGGSDGEPGWVPAST